MSAKAGDAITGTDPRLAAVPSFTFTDEVFPWDDEGPSWRFIRVPQDVADDIRGLPIEPRRSGTVGVQARIGETSWSTSLFPEKSSGSYLLAVKKSVREREGIDDGDVVAVELVV